MILNCKMKRHSIENINSNSLKLSKEQKTQEGVFETRNGKYIVVVKKYAKRNNRIFYNTISQHIKEADAINAFNEYKNKYGSLIFKNKT